MAAITYQKIKSAVTGILAGLTNGLLGAGGGMILIPLFLHWLKMDERKTFATSVCVILPLCIISATVYFLKGNLDISSALPYLLGGLIGGFISGKIFKTISLDLLRRAFGIIIIIGGIRALIW